MNTLENYAPSFYGKDAIEKLNTWNTLLFANDFASLISRQEAGMVTYIANLRKAEIFEQCANAITELKRLKSFVSWEEDYSLDYSIYNTLTFYCDNADEFASYANKTSRITSDWIVNETYQQGGGGCLDWELSEGFNDGAPGEIHISSLSLVSIGAEQIACPSSSIG